MKRPYIGVLCILTNETFPDYIKIMFAHNTNSLLCQLNKSVYMPKPFKVYKEVPVYRSVSQQEISHLVRELFPDIQGVKSFYKKDKHDEFYKISCKEAAQVLDALVKTPKMADLVNFNDFYEQHLKLKYKDGIVPCYPEAYKSLEYIAFECYCIINAVESINESKSSINSESLKDIYFCFYNLQQILVAQGIISKMFYGKFKETKICVSNLFKEQDNISLFKEHIARNAWIHYNEKVWDYDFSTDFFVFRSGESVPKNIRGRALDVDTLTYYYSVESYSGRINEAQTIDLYELKIQAEIIFSVIKQETKDLYHNITYLGLW